MRTNGNIKHGDIILYFMVGNPAQKTDHILVSIGFVISHQFVKTRTVTKKNHSRIMFTQVNFIEHINQLVDVMP